VRLVLVSVLEAEVETLIGANRYERSPLRRDRRNGHYTRDLDTRVGRINVTSIRIFCSAEIHTT
jgi:putative transposase